MSHSGGQIFLCALYLYPRRLYNNSVFHFSCFAWQPKGPHKLNTKQVISGVFRIVLKICDGAFYGNSLGFQPLTIFAKKQKKSTKNQCWSRCWGFKMVLKNSQLICKKYKQSEMKCSKTQKMFKRNGLLLLFVSRVEGQLKGSTVIRGNMV